MKIVPLSGVQAGDESQGCGLAAAALKHDKFGY
jgi:hypothetical protein